MPTVVLYQISHDGFHKTVTARVQRGALDVSSHAFDTEGYDQEFDLRVARRNIPALRNAIGLSRLRRRSLLPTPQARYSTIRADSDIAKLLKDAGIATTTTGYTSFP